MGAKDGRKDPPWGWGQPPTLEPVGESPQGRPFLRVTVVSSPVPSHPPLKRQFLGVGTSPAWAARSTTRFRPWGPAASVPCGHAR